MGRVGDDVTLKAPESEPGAPGDEAAPTPADGKRPPGIGRRQRIRSVLTAVLVVIASVGVTVSSVSVWAHRLVFNTDQWVSTVGPLAHNEDVIASVTNRVTHQVDDALNPQALASEHLPSSLQSLSAPIAQGINQLVASAVSGVMHSDAFQNFWIKLNRAVQPRVAAALLGEPTAHLETANGTIQLNYLPLISKALAAVNKRAPKLLDLHGPVPVITASTPVDQAQAELSQALGRPLPATYGLVTLVHSDQLAAAQHAVTVVNRLIVALIVLTALSMAGALLLSRRRLRTALALGIGIILALGLCVAMTRAITNQIVSSVADPGDQKAVRSTLGTVFDQLDAITAILMGIALIVIAVVVLTGGGRRGAQTRRSIGALARSVTRRSPEGTVPRFLVEIHRYHLVLVLAGLVIGFVVVVAAVDSWVGLLTTVLVVAAYEGLVLWVDRSVATGLSAPRRANQDVSGAGISAGRSPQS